MDNEYPKFLCRLGGDEEAWGVKIESGFSTDADDDAAKLADGWYRTPADFPDPDAPKAKPDKVKTDGA